MTQQHPGRDSPPVWWTDMAAVDGAAPLRVAEWENGPEWRRENGWTGSDFVHAQTAPVHIPGYLLDSPGGGPRLVGAAHFGPAAESHRGLCHGGTMCALMDDVIGWCGFCASGTCEPWSGFTVQIDTSLRAPVAVGAWLRVEATIVRREGRKVWVEASLSDPLACSDGRPRVHCEAKGLFLITKEDTCQ